MVSMALKHMGNDISALVGANVFQVWEPGLKNDSHVASFSETRMSSYFFYTTAFVVCNIRKGVVVETIFYLVYLFFRSTSPLQDN
jgi:hypothetical protein